MAKNVGGRRIGAIRGRTQFRLPNGHYAKRDRRTGEIISIKADRKPYKNVVIEREPILPAPAREDAPVMTTADAGRISLPLLHRPSWRVRQQPARRAVALGMAGTATNLAQR